MGAEQVENEVILITGGTGFAGSHLAELLVAENVGELHVTNFSGKLPNLSAFEKIQAHSLDLTDAAATAALIKQLQPTQIYHLASFAFVGESFKKAQHLLNNNISLQLNLLNAVIEHAPQTRILLTGSAEEYGISELPGEIPMKEDHPLRPINPYAVSKVAQDLLGYAFAKSYGLQIVRVRPFNHIGERQTEDFAVSAFAKQIVQIEQGKQTALLVGNLSGVRDFTDVKDMVKAYYLLMQKGVVGEVYNVGTGAGVRMQAIVDSLISLADVPIPIETDQNRLRPLDIPEIIANNEKVRQLGWSPTVPLQESLQRVLAYWRSV